MYNFVTLFDSNYLLKGLVLYESLVEYMADSRLFVIAFDDIAYRKLIELSLPQMIVISLEEFEDEELLSVKNQRSKGEYCWTSTPKSVIYILEKYNVESCTYIDADLCFYSSPSVLIEELNKNDSVSIIEHRYSDYCDQTDISGKYCVQFMTFKNDTQGKKVLNWWKDQCIEWCYGRYEDGKMGDQKYLDTWCEKFDGIHVIQNLGGGVAPWNASQYTFKIEDDYVYLCKNNQLNKEYKVVFYHFHALRTFDKDVVHLAPNMYKLPDTCVTYIYKKYIKYMEIVKKKYLMNDDLTKWDIVEQFQSNDLDVLKHEKNYYHYLLFV